MILAFAAKGKKTIACTLLVLMYFEMVVPAYALNTVGRSNPSMQPVDSGLAYPAYKASVITAAAAPASAKKAFGGPTQPESQAFQSVNADNMVDMFTGDFSYNIPLIDVGGYPLGIGYTGGIDMSQEASWTGLGWNINPGAITRNLRGIPDDFNGLDSITKTASVKENKTIGASGAMGMELGGLPLNLNWNLGIFHNTYRGWGVETGLNASLNVAGSTASVGLKNSSQEGFSVSPSLGFSFSEQSSKLKGGISGDVSIGLSYNSRGGMKALEMPIGINLSKRVSKITTLGTGGKLNSSISFANPSFTPTINMPYTSSMYSATLKIGGLAKILVTSFSINGYISKQLIEKADTSMYLPAYGYLNFQDGAKDPAALLDFNREREIPYRDNIEFPNIAIPSYTYDVFSISGEGTGGMFRAYRSDIGSVNDHAMRTKDKSAAGNLDLGFGDLFHVGIDVTVNRAYNQSGAWRAANPLAGTIAFTKSDKNYEAVYLRNPGEKTINTRDFYTAIGGDDVVIPKLFRSSPGSSNITTTNYLTKFRGGKKLEDVKLTKANAVKQTRDKRTQVITYLKASEAAEIGFPKYIEDYSLNKYTIANCETAFPDEMDEDGTGFKGEYFNGEKEGILVKKFEMIDTAINFGDNNALRNNRPAGVPPINQFDYYVHWTGRIKAPVTGQYTVKIRSDDGVILKVNDTAVLTHWDVHPNTEDIRTLNLEAGKVYKVSLEYFQDQGDVIMTMEWKCGNVVVTKKDMYLPDTTDIFESVPNALYKEERINNFRKSNHISQVDVLNSDGRRYVYGIPVYNLKQKEVTFSVKNENGNAEEGTVSYAPGVDNHTGNLNGNDHSYTSEEIPAYAHSFLLTGVVSPDYVDISGDGISDDDPGDAIKFNYTKTAGVKNPYKWRTPYSGKASYNEGLKTETRDDKGSYVYGEKELWYLNSIESKTMIATFKLGNRDDLAPINEDGVRDTANHVAKRLEEINLYTKADFLKNPAKARPVKTVHFEYTYELCSGVNGSGDTKGKLTLKRIWFTYNGNKKGQKNAYVFNYNQKNPGHDHKSFDRWGNYKTPLQNPNSTTGNLVTNAQYPYALQDSTLAAENVAAWTLDSIVLPSGGRMKVTYESDDYAYVQNKRAAQMFNVAGFSYGEPVTLNSLSDRLYDARDNLYMAINVSEPVTSKREVYTKYLQGMDKLYFRLHVNMPNTDKFGTGAEFIPGYAKIDGSSYGFINNGNTIWVKVVSVDKKGLDIGEYSPMAKTAISFLRLNLPSKAYPGSDIGDNLELADGIQMVASMGGNIINAFRSFDATARANRWARVVDLSRSLVRLNSPGYKKYGGGLRVKKIVIYDHWNAMTGKKESMYGTEYSYTTVKNIDGKNKVISSGVAVYEPMLGGEENPFRLPLEYREQVAALAPASMGYVETPLGESFFPGASVGYSQVRKRSIKTKNTRSANGYEESNFYTAYDFPIITEHSLLDGDTKLRYKPALGNFLKVNAKHHMVISQGFKVELNDMHGKPKSQATYAETDPVSPISSSKYYYHVDDQHAEFKHLKNSVLSMSAQGVIDSAAVIGKDMELMMDMREQKFVANSLDVNGNMELFLFSIPPVLTYGSLFALPQRQETMFRSVAATKVINRHGLLDSVVVVEKGSKVVTHNLLYDGETGDPILTATQNEFGDSVFQFNYPAAWVYDGMGGAYQNIHTTLANINIKEGRITNNFGSESVNTYFASGDEILVYSRNKVGGADCPDPLLATFKSVSKIWAVDANALNGGNPSLFFMDANGKPFTGDDMDMKVIRSGRKNITASVGSVTMLANPLKKVGIDGYALVIDKDSKIINASMVEYKQNWQVEDDKKQKIICAY